MCIRDSSYTDPSSIANPRRVYFPGVRPDGLITMLTNLEHIPPKITDYAEAVASNSYRRQYRNMVERLSRQAHTAPEKDLYPLLVKEGKKTTPH
ncbi:hypothetical protein, partial [Corynebacterium striatum]|uniref:hypothetical protein n=1 Tax=Corynebacterium striatum TaxID=43770 RepID=UPI003F4D7FDA